MAWHEVFYAPVVRLIDGQAVPFALSPLDGNMMFARAIRSNEQLRCILKETLFDLILGFG